MVSEGAQGSSKDKERGGGGAQGSGGKRTAHCAASRSAQADRMATREDISEGWPTQRDAKECIPLMIFYGVLTAFQFFFIIGNTICAVLSAKTRDSANCFFIVKRSE